MNNIAKPFKRGIKTKIMLGLSVMLLVGISSLIAVYLVVHSQRTDALVINHAGKLRMYSQKITKATLMSVAGNSLARAEAEETIQEFDNTILLVLNGDLTQNIPPAPQAAITQLKKVRKTWGEFESTINRIIHLSPENAAFQGLALELGEQNLTLLHEANESVKLLEAAAQEKISTMFKLLGVSIGLFLVLFLFIYRVVNTSIKPIKALVEATNKVVQGDLNVRVDVRTKDELGLLSQSFNTMVASIHSSKEELIEGKEQMELALKEREQINKELKENDDKNTRIREALDKASSSIVVVDDDLKVLYLNESSQGLFMKATTEIKKVYPGFDPTRIAGMDIDLIHGGSSITKNDLVKLTSSSRLDFELGDRSFRVISNPVFDVSGERLGTMMEWTDRTEADAVERELESIVEFASSGALNRRIALEDKNGFYYRMSQQVNRLVGVAEKVVTDMIRVLGAMSRGDLTEKILEDYAGVFGELKHDTNATVEKLTEVMTEIKNTAQRVNAGAIDIADGNTNLSRRTELQASNLGNTASSMEEITSTVKQNARNASEADELSQMLKSQAQKGGVVVKKAVTAMSEINDSSKKISDIIGVINEIAFQTNLLALNAAVEAARAGDQGRGFAVVAAEVRNLAGRSATAAKEIKDLIEDSSEKVQEGSRLVNESGATLDEILAGVKKVTDIVGEIAAASQEQSVGIDHINQAIAEMDLLTQQNASLVQEAAAASRSLGSQANGLDSLMSFFSLDPAFNTLFSASDS